MHWGWAVNPLRSVSRGALCWHREGSAEPGCSGCHLLCFFFRDSFPRVQNFCNQRHHGVTVQAGSCGHKTIPEGESRRTWISAQIPQRGSSPLPPPGQMCFGRLRAGWPMPQGARGLAADLLGAAGAGHQVWGQRERGRIPGSLPSWCLHPSAGFSRFGYGAAWLVSDLLWKVLETQPLLRAYPACFALKLSPCWFSGKKCTAPGG